MDQKKIMEEFLRWKQCAGEDNDIANELRELEGDSSGIEDAFYKDLTFGTGGLRGVIGAGTNRMNIYTVAKASQGLSDYVNKHFPEGMCSIAVSFDSRIGSERFSKAAAGVFAANGIRVYIYPELMPTPCLSFAVRELGCAAGVMVTASHNPAKYNGYKVYGPDGCQITTETAEEIQTEIGKLDIFDDVRTGDFDAGVAAGEIQYIPETVCTAFINAVKSQSMADETGKIDKDVAIVYTSLNGTGVKPVLRTLKESGYNNITVVSEQEQPDGRFPTCPYPNPEISEAMALGIRYARRARADLLLATDPDCDRVGIAVPGPDGNYVLLSGNETGMLLLDYICMRHKERGSMPEEPVFIKTIVTTDMAERIAAGYGVRTVNVLTGFKFIGEQIGLLEKEDKADSYLFGFEESCGYLSGPYVRDKDGVGASLLICEMLACYKARGLSLLEKLEGLYETFGYCLNTLHSFEFEGISGQERIKSIMAHFRKDVDVFAGKKVLSCQDYLQGLDGLPRSDVLKFILEDHCSVVVRPSGTEPKLKVYISVSAKDAGAAQETEKRIAEELNGCCVS